METICTKRASSDDDEQNASKTYVQHNNHDCIRQIIIILCYRNNQLRYKHAAAAPDSQLAIFIFIYFYIQDNQQFALYINTHYAAITINTI